MDILIHTNGLTLQDDFKAAVEEKIGRVVQYAPRALRARVHVRRISAHPSEQQFEVRVRFELPGHDLIAEERGPNLLPALDLVSEKIERRLRKLKTARLARRVRDRRARGTPTPP